MTIKTQHPASVRAEQNSREIRLYGCTIKEMSEAISESMVRFDGPADYAIKLMNDCQDMLASDNGGSYDFNTVEDVRQTLNRAKWILQTYLTKI